MNNLKIEGNRIVRFPSPAQQLAYQIGLREGMKLILDEALTTLRANDDNGGPDFEALLAALDLDAILAAHAKEQRA